MDERIKVTARLHPEVLNELMLKFGEKDGQKISSYEVVHDVLTLTANRLRAHRGLTPIDATTSRRGKRKCTSRSNI